MYQPEEAEELDSEPSTATSGKRSSGYDPLRQIPSNLQRQDDHIV